MSQSITVDDQKVLDVVNHFNTFIVGKRVPDMVTDDVIELVVTVAIESTKLNISDPGVLLRLLAMGIYLAETGKTHLTHPQVAVQ